MHTPHHLIALCLTSIFLFTAVHGQGSLTNTQVDGYRGIWFELNQKYAYGDKYSGGLGTYTAKHIPLAIYAPEVDKTFFVYGGTIDVEQKHLLCMIGIYDHASGQVSKPRVVYDKNGVDDPHDNPSISLDAKGYIWVFVSGRGSKRPGFKYKSKQPYSIDEFEQISEEEFTYPQIWKTKKGFVHLFTKYTGVRQLYYETSKDGINWAEDRMLAAIPAVEGERSGHYQLSYCYKNKQVGTFFNRHLDGHPDTRTDLYYVQSRNFAKTWTDVTGKKLTLPLTQRAVSARVIDYQSQGKNIYMKDMGYDKNGNPVCLYVRSNGHEPGPENAPYEWCLTRWNGKIWETTVVCTSDHNYDMGSLFIDGNTWKIVGPTGVGPQQHGVGGEISIWQSQDGGKNWALEKTITQNSVRNHAYVRRPLGYKAPFCFFWADGDPHQFSRSELYFGDFEGNVYQLPYEMNQEYEKPVRVYQP